MKFTEFFVKRPITTIMLMLSIVVVGVMSLWQLKIDLMPELKFPNLVVVTEYSGVAPLEIEKLLSKPLETAIRTVPGIKNVKTSSREGLSVVNAEFTWGTNLDDAANQIRDRIGQIKKYLPKDASEPIIIKMEMSSIPVAFMSVRGKKSLEILQKIAEDTIQPKLEKLDGVAGVLTMGGREREIQINVDRNKLEKLGLSLSQIVMKIGMENLNVSAGNINESAETEYIVRGIGEFQKIEDIENTVIGVRNNIPIYLKEVATVIDGLADEKGASRSNRMTAVSIIVQKESDANTVDVSRRIKNILPSIRKELPEGVTFDFIFDISEIVENSIRALERSAIEGAILAAIIIFIFLGKVNPTLIVCISIPISLLIAFAAIFFGGYTINIMTLGALVIALGRLVDDSVVVMENIFRRRQLGETAIVASVEGTKEVSIAVIASTVVTVVVFLPIAFARGIVVQLFREFGMTIFYALAASLLVAFTVVPMLASKLFKRGIESYESKKQSFFGKIKNFYGKSLYFALSHKVFVIIGAVVILIITGILFMSIGKEFIPNVVSGRYQIYCKLPKGSTLSATKNLFLRVENDLYSKVSDLENLGGTVGTSGKLSGRMSAMSGMSQGPNTAQMFINLKKGKRETSENKLHDIIDNIAKSNKGAEITLSAPGTQFFRTGRAIEIKIYGDDLSLLKQIGKEIADEIKDIKGLKGVSSSMEEGLPEITFEFNREKLTRYGLTVAQVNNEIRTAIEGQVASIYREKGEEVDIRVRLKDEYRRNLKDLLQIPISSPLGFIFPLKDVAKVSYSEGPSEINRENAKRMVVVSADISGRSLSKVVDDIREKLKKIKLPLGYSYEFGGEEKDRQESFFVLLIALLMAILLIYMILASLYESLIHPFTIMLSVPFAFTGAILALYITNTPLGVTAMIGLIMLVGIVATNAIVMVDFIIKRRQVEKDRRKAIVEAATIRLRPILITALATLFALLPIALGRAEGQELQIPLGIAVVGGLFSSTFLTLYIVPTVYEILDPLSRKSIKEKD